MALMLLGIMLPVSAQLTEKEQKAIAKEAKKEAKRLTKEGWKVPAGGFSIERQLNNAYQMQAEVNVDRQPKYIFGQAISGGSFYDAAKMQALELVRAELAANITTDITTLVNIQLENQQLSAEKASSASKIMEKGKALVSQKLYSTIPLIEIYRQNPEGNVEVQIRLAYDKEEAVKVGVNALKAELEKEGIEF